MIIHYEPAIFADPKTTPQTSVGTAGALGVRAEGLHLILRWCLETWGAGADGTLCNRRVDVQRAPHGFNKAFCLCIASEVLSIFLWLSEDQFWESKSLILQSCLLKFIRPQSYSTRILKAKKHNGKELANDYFMRRPEMMKRRRDGRRSLATRLYRWWTRVRANSYHIYQPKESNYIKLIFHAMSTSTISIHNHVYVHLWTSCYIHATISEVTLGQISLVSHQSPPGGSTRRISSSHGWDSTSGYQPVGSLQPVSFTP